MKKTALITGGARGIGYGTARCLAREGYGLAIDDIRDESEFSTARQELRNLGAEVYCRADISDAADRQRLLEEVRAAYSGLNVLVNNTDVTPLKRADLLEA